MLGPVALCSLLWIAWAVVVHRAARRSPGAAPLTALRLLLIRALVRARHRVCVAGGDRIPDAPPAGGLILVANHVSGADPLLIQAVCPFEITWLMGQDMAHPALAAWWRRAGVILVDRRAGRAFPLRDALAVLRAGGALGVFPEGRITRGAGTLRPFHPGVAMLARRSGAIVLPVLIERPPVSRSVWLDACVRSRPGLRVLAARTVDGMHDADAAARLRAEIALETGWPPSAERE